MSRYILLILLVLVIPWSLQAESKIESILKKVEARYGGRGFSASFKQTSTLKALELTDSASGSLFIQHPGRMRWVYEKPEKQIIVSNGKSLWVYRPEDNQVMIGDARVYFSNGKGASFLSDINIIRSKFEVSIEKETTSKFVLKLIPKEKKFEISMIHLHIAKQTNDLVMIASYNTYGDETLIKLTAFRYDLDLDAKLFHLEIPKDADILQLEE